MIRFTEAVKRETIGLLGNGIDEIERHGWWQSSTGTGRTSLANGTVLPHQMSGAKCLGTSVRHQKFALHYIRQALKIPARDLLDGANDIWTVNDAMTPGIEGFNWALDTLRKARELAQAAEAEPDLMYVG